MELICVLAGDIFHARLRVSLALDRSSTKGSYCSQHIAMATT